MDEKRWARIGEIFLAVAERDSPEDRDRMLEQACAGDADLMREVSELLNAHDRPKGFLESPSVLDAEKVIARRLSQRWIGQTLGHWTIEAPVHEGGMGAVFRVRRSGHDFEQIAALKLIRFGLESPDLVRRFARERQVLASLEHPSIARLLDGGTTEEGLPYLVMEYVDGKPIDDWCDQHRLGISARLRLFIKVCDAIHFAHQKLVIHRDLKPSNILVDESGQPKLLDFGIAKLISDSADDEDLTQTRNRIFTPSISSPEQFLGGPISTATDVHGLGALLYRLLAGRPPFRMDSTTSIPEITQRICHQMPTPPSKAIAESDDRVALAGARNTRWERLQRQLSGDLDTIILKSMRKEPERRYRSVEALARDLDRHLSGLPVSAQPDSMRYRTGKFVSRHWKGLAATAVAFATLTLSLGVALWQAEQARNERDRTLRINEFLQTILVEADPYEAGADATVRDLLRKASQMVGERFSGQPDLEAPLRYTIGYTQLGLMELEDALANLTRADELNHQLHGPDDERSLRTRAYLAWIDFRKGQYDRANDAYQTLIQRLQPSHSPELQSTIFNDYGIVLAEQERYAEAADLHKRALALQQEQDPDDPKISIIYNNIAYAYHGLENLEQAETWYRKALELRRAASPDGQDPDLAYNLNNLGILLRDLDRTDEALPMYQESLAIRQASLGPDHAFTGIGHLNLGRFLLELDRPDEARPHLEQAVRISRATLEEDQLQTLLARASWARMQSLDGDHHSAAAELTDVLEAMYRIGAPAQFTSQAAAWKSEASMSEQSSKSIREE